MFGSSSKATIDINRLISYRAPDIQVTGDQRHRFCQVTSTIPGLLSVDLPVPLRIVAWRSPGCELVGHADGSLCRLPAHHFGSWRPGGHLYLLGLVAMVSSCLAQMRKVFLGVLLRAEPSSSLCFFILDRCGGQDAPAGC